MIKRIIKFGFKKMGFSIQRIQKTMEFTMEGALERCINRGLVINSVIDVGASDGRWSEKCMQFIPKAEYLLIEAQNEHKDGLDKFKRERANADYVLAAAGRKAGKIYFDNEDLFGGLASETPLAKNYIEVPVVTIDEEVRKRNLKPPFLIKLDTHGFEVPILEGAVDTIKRSGLIIIETYNYKLTQDSLKYFEMCRYMENLGFSSIEMVNFLLRKYDNSFWQMDTFFIPSKSKEFKHNAYK